MDSRHTSGPWTAEPTSTQEFNIYYGKCWVASAQGCRVGNAHAEELGVVDHFPLSHEECAANARLIAAAPELLEALKDASCTLTSCDGAEMEYEVAKDLIALLKRINAAITKAEGRE